MKTPLSFYFIAAVAGALACSDEGGTDRNTGGTGGSAPVGQAGSGQGTAGSSQASGGSGQGTAGSSGNGGPNLGPILSITGSGGDVVVQDLAGNTNITGGLILAQSATMTVPATFGTTEGALCMKGTTAVVPNDSSYGTHWGAEISLDLNRAAVSGAGADAGAADAGADAGGGSVLGTEAAPWPIGNVIGFSYKITGNDPALPGGGVSPAAFRFKAVPQGADTAIDTYCKTLTPINNATENSLFTEILFECWDTTNPSIAAPMLTHSVMMQGMRSMRENPNALMSISWQIPADLTIGHAFDFCISDLRPILAP